MTRNNENVHYSLAVDYQLHVAFLNNYALRDAAPGARAECGWRAQREVFQSQWLG